jgi:hypothetical protein
LTYAALSPDEHINGNRRQMFHSPGLMHALVQRAAALPISGVTAKWRHIRNSAHALHLKRRRGHLGGADRAQAVLCDFRPVNAAKAVMTCE